MTTHQSDVPERPPPQPLPEQLWGDQWQFVMLSAEALEKELLQRPIPIQATPEYLRPSALQLARTTPIPGVVIYGDRQSMKLARWFDQQQPVNLQAVQAELGGLVLTSEESDRWIVVTYDDPDVASAAQTFEHRKLESKGLHFLLVQPDDSGVTFTGIWLLRSADRI